jgi:hypothetical protein
MKVAIEDVEKYLEFRAEVNSAKLEEIEWTYKGEKIKVDSKLVEKHFGDLFMEALNSKNLELAYKIIDRCPDFITRIFMLDAIKQYEKEKTNGN